MFDLNWVQAVMAVLWLVGVICAVTAFARGRRGLGGIFLVAAALVVPVLGSLLAVGIVALNSRSHGVTQ
ncbi:hypothetical protein [Intrasporangium sp. YIM S08009]|uniref:hypothetical protein n=1 Tax=Intrasporangium zincisolvens TaxID=3080018 RepID=UPI002B05575C|nr:hypothetical protein [Intrasporangium sp. YIM S08009]